MNEEDTKTLIAMVDRLLKLNEEKTQIIFSHYEDMKRFASSYADLAAQMMGAHIQQPVEQQEIYRAMGMIEEEPDPSMTGGELNG